MMEGNAALWTTDATTVVLPHVSVAYWAVPAESTNSSEAPVPFSSRWRRTLIEDSTCFVIEYAGGHSLYFDGDNHRRYGISFLRALSLYWETRA